MEASHSFTMSAGDSEHDELGSEPPLKRAKVDSEVGFEIASHISHVTKEDLAGSSDLPERHLPPSHALLGISPMTNHGPRPKLTESDVGISEYVDRDLPRVEGIIKQRFTDFLVFEVGLDGKVLHLHSLEMPQPSIESRQEEGTNAGLSEQTMPRSGDEVAKKNLHGASEAKDVNLWPNESDIALQPYFSESAIFELKRMFSEGPDPPAHHRADLSERPCDANDSMDVDEHPDITELSQPPPGEREREKRGHAEHEGRVASRGQRSRKKDMRKVLSEPISSKDTRTILHQLVRTLFKGKLESEIDTAEGTADSPRIAIRWSKRRGSRGGRGDDRSPRGSFPAYIHFSLQKTNRDTQDVLLHLSRLLRTNVKELSVAGTKDKRGITVQRVSLKRGNKTTEGVWKMLNGPNIRKGSKDALSCHGDRGVRIADLEYHPASLELGMLKGNAFVITLRNFRVDSAETLDRAMNTIKNKGFINYYGMQRFGTASVPTHSIGLAILQSDWHKAISLILQKRPGEHPDVVAAREAWLVDGDLAKALELMPRRVVAERCILQSYKKQKGETRNAMGALSTIPRNLRLMYVHAYQSYVWNALVSERIRIGGCEKPIVGDLVFEADAEESVDDVDLHLEDLAVEMLEGAPEVLQDLGERASNKGDARVDSRKSRKPWVPPRVKKLAQGDLDKYSIFDVIMPLPGKDITYPGGKLGEKYREYLRMDGLDPDNLERKQKDYSLSGSYRKVMHLPKELSWSTLRYTDPDVPLAQSDEDRLLNFDPPIISEEGRFIALQIKTTLGTAAYATMALREITKTETSSLYQTALTQTSEDQQFRGTGASS